MAAISLVEYSKQAFNQGKFRDAQIALQFAMNAPLLDAMPFRTIDANIYEYRREESLPGVTYRGLNEAFSTDYGVVNPQFESMKFGGGDLDVDVELVNGAADPTRTEMENQQIRAIALKAQKSFIKGDSGSDPREPDGLQVRLTGTQLITPGTTAGGDALKLSTLTRAYFQTRRPTHWIMNRTMAIRLTQSTNDQGITNTPATRDEFGRPLLMYAGLPIIVLEEDDEGNEILDFNEANPNASSVSTGSTSIYCVSLMDGMLFGLQKRPIQARDLGELETKPVYRTRVDWAHSLCIKDGRSATRIAGIDDTAIVTG